MKLGLALSGGGIRGIAHAGVLKALEENNIALDILAGTSSGSHIAILTALGFCATEIYNLFNQYAYQLVGNNAEVIILDSLLFNKKMTFDGLRSGQPIEELYNTIARQKGFHTMKDLKMPVATVCTDMIEEKEMVCASMIPEGVPYIDDIEIGKAVRASSSFSVVFNPCSYHDKILLDGGILNNVPVDVARTLGADKVIAVNFSSDKITPNSNMMDIGMKTIDMMSNKISEMHLKNSDLILTVDTDGTGLLDIDNVDYCFQAGYETALEHMDSIKAIVKQE